jgi:hypothetical protein
MKIGILFTCYNCEEYVDRCIAPWINIKDRHEIIFACNSGMFRDYFDLGIPENNKGTLEKLISNQLDFLVTTSGRNLLDEDSSRNLSLDFLKKQDCDLLVYLDGDEIYTEAQIISILDFIQDNPEFDQYGICFKNYTINDGLFLNNFIRKSIYWMKRYGGINRFYFDSDFIYNDPNSIYTNTTVIPKEIAFVDHYSWLSDDPRTRSKIKYQNMRYVGTNSDIPENLRCAFAWDEEGDKLAFNRDFWDHFRREQIPILKKQIGTKYTFDFELDFDRAENRINVINLKGIGSYEFVISDSNEQHVYTTHLNLHPGITYWIAPSNYRFFNEEPETYYLEISVSKDGDNVHSERLYLKT